MTSWHEAAQWYLDQKNKKEAALALAETFGVSKEKVFEKLHAAGVRFNQLPRNREDKKTEPEKKPEEEQKCELVLLKKFGNENDRFLAQTPRALRSGDVVFYRSEGEMQIYICESDSFRTEQSVTNAPMIAGKLKAELFCEEEEKA
ncbi:MAG: hypothetical protein KBS59_03140 [Clostridiales bacterium]|nr:hypothetical protein [Clostridiales bacterium]